MRRLIPFGLFIFAVSPLACSGAAAPDGTSSTTDEALTANSGLPVLTLPKGTLAPTPTPTVKGGWQIFPPPRFPFNPAAPVACTSQMISWGTDPTVNVCGGGFEYSAYKAPCYASKENGACGPPTKVQQKTCHWKFDCRMPAFGVEQTLPNVTFTTSWPVGTLSQVGGGDCNGWYGQMEDSWTHIAPSVNNGLPPQGYASDTKTSKWTPTTSDYYGAGNESCTITFNGVVEYNTFHEYTVANDFRYDDYYDNPCPENPDPSQAWDCSIPTQWPSCRLSQNGLDPDPSACGNVPGNAYTAAGITQSAFSGGTSPSCTSCEDAPIDDPSLPTASATKAQIKGKCIVDRLAQVANAQAPATTFNASLQAKLVAELKLLSELEGQLLTSDQEAAAWKADLQTDDTESCEAAAWAPTTAIPATCAPPAVPAGVTTTFDLYMRRALSACARFEQPHASAASTAAMAPRCFALSATIPKDASTTCSYKAYRDEYRTVANSLIMKIVGSLEIDPSSDSIDVIQSKLGLIEQWYEGMRAIYPAGTDRTALWGDTSAVMGAFWQQAFSKPFTAVVASNAKASNQFLTDASTVVRKVFGAAFQTGASGSYPLHSAPLLYLLSDGFQTVIGRLDYVGLFHDMACRFKGCIGGNVQTEVSQMWKVLSLLGDGALLPAAVTNAKLIRPEWSTVLAEIGTAHAATIEAAALDAFGTTTYSTSLFSKATAATSPSPVLGLAQTIQKASTRTNNYASTGLLSSNATNEINIGLQNATIGTNSGGTESLLARIQKLEDDLNAQVVKYTGAQQGAVTGILAQLGADQKDAQLQSQLQASIDQFNHLSKEIAGLTDADAFQETAFGEFMQAYDGVTKSDSVDPTLMIQRHFISTNVPPTMAKATKDQAWQDIQQVAVQPSGGSGFTVPIHAAQGWILNIGTTGHWTPSCAVRTAPMPGGSSIPGAESSPIGPEGYYVSASGSSLTANSNSTVDANGRHAEVDTTQKLCGGIKGSAGISFLGNGGGVYFDASVCTSADEGASRAHTSSLSSSNGNEGRVTASFSSGLRVAGTPFPEAPAGALLLVEMAAGKRTPQDILDVRVVQSPSMSVLIDPAAGTDVYLVDNDVKDCTYSAPGALNVTIAELESSGAMFAQIGTAMTKALGHIRSQGSAIIAQGTVLPDDMARLRSTAAADLATSVPDVTKVPAALIALFNAYVDEQVVHLERVVEIYNDEYQRDLITLSLKQIDDDIAANQNQARYYELLTANSMANMDADWLTVDVNPLLALVTNELYPAAVLRYPDSIPAIRTGESGLLDQMTTQLDWTTVSVGLATQAVNLVGAIQREFESAVGSLPNGQNTTQIVVAFPNPDLVTSQFAAPSAWYAADAETSRAVWNAAKTGTVASITLRPEHIYKNRTQGALPCNRLAPIIDDMALFLAEPNGLTTPIDNATDNGGHPTDLIAHDAMSFTTPTGLSLYRFTDPRWLNSSSIFVIGGSVTDLLKTFTQALATYPTNFSAGSGLSPFATFDIDMSVAKDLIDQAQTTLSEIDLVLQVETTPLSSPLIWIDTCKQ